MKNQEIISHSLKYEMFRSVSRYKKIWNWKSIKNKGKLMKIIKKLI